jgi:hypothetical protein
MAGLFGNSRGGGPGGLFAGSSGFSQEQQRLLADLAAQLGGSSQGLGLPIAPFRESSGQSPVAQRNFLVGGGGPPPFGPASSGLPFSPSFAGDPQVLGGHGAAGDSLGRPPIDGLRAEAEGYADQVAQRGTPGWGSALKDFVTRGPVRSLNGGGRLDEKPLRGEVPKGAEEEGLGFDLGPVEMQTGGFGRAEAEVEDPRPAALFWEGEDTSTQFMRPVAFQDSFDRAQDRAIAQEQAKRTGGNADEIYKVLRGGPDPGRTQLTPLHQEISQIAEKYRPREGTREWTDADAVGYAAGRDIFPFKDQWVRGHRDAILAAARQYDLPPALLAGVAYHEVGGDPPSIDRVIYGIRDNAVIKRAKVSPAGKLLPGSVKRPADRTSFGSVTMQVRTAAEAFGYKEPGPWQKKAIISSLQDPSMNIFIAAKHLSDLRNRDFRGTAAPAMTREQIEVIATRFNKGSGRSVSEIKKDLDYGKDITKRWGHLNALLTAR